MTPYIDPDRETFRAFRQMERTGPLHMLNLVQLNAIARYPDGRQVSGEEAYAAYGRDSGPIFTALGGRIVWRGRYEMMLIGPGEAQWDHCFIAEYPDLDAFVGMIRNPDYQKAVIHRQVAVRTSRLMRMEPLESGAAFSG